MTNNCVYYYKLQKYLCVTVTERHTPFWEVPISCGRWMWTRCYSGYSVWTVYARNKTLCETETNSLWNHRYL